MVLVEYEEKRTKIMRLLQMKLVGWLGLDQAMLCYVVIISLLGIWTELPSFRRPLEEAEA